MADFDKFELEEHQKVVKLIAEHMGVFGMKRHLPWVKDDPDFLKMQQTLRFFELLSEQELRDHRLIRGEVKARLAAGTGMSAHEVNQLLLQFKTNSVLFDAIKHERAADRPLPTSQAESSRLIQMYGMRNPAMMNKLSSRYKSKASRGPLGSK